MSLFQALTQGTNALHVLQKEFNINANNITHASDPNYHRREAKITSTNTGEISLSYVNRACNAGLEAQILASGSALQAMKTQEEIGKGLNASLVEQDNTFLLAKKFNDFEKMWQELEVNPSLPGLQEEIVNKGYEITSVIRAAAHSSDVLKRETNVEMDTTINQINTLLDKLDDFNKKNLLYKYKFLDKDSNSDIDSLDDQQSATITELSQLIDITPEPQRNGTIWIRTKLGSPLLMNDPSHLSYCSDSSTIIKNDTQLPIIVSGGSLFAQYSALRKDPEALASPDFSLGSFAKFENTLDNIAEMLLDDFQCTSYGGFVYAGENLEQEKSLIPGNSFSIAAGTLPPRTITITAGMTPEDLLTAINAFPEFKASVTPNGILAIKTYEPTLTLNNVVGTPLTNLSFNTGIHKANPLSFSAAYNQTPTQAGEAPTFFINNSPTAPVDRYSLDINSDLLHGAQNIKSASALKILEALRAEGQHFPSPSGNQRVPQTYEGEISYHFMTQVNHLSQYQKDIASSEGVHNHLQIILSNEIGVDMDNELSIMIQLQQSFASEAKIIGAVQGMLDDLFMAIK